MKYTVTACILAAAIMTETPVMAASDVLFSDSIQTEAFTDEIPVVEEPEPEWVEEASKSAKVGWERKPSGRCFWRMSNGKFLKESGPHKLGGKKYYLNSGGSRAEDCWKLIKGKRYYFQKNGVMYQKKGWFENRGYKYYINSDGSRTTGFRTVQGRLHYFDEYGRILSNKEMYKINNKYYNIDAKCNVKEIPEKQALCTLETRKFIEGHTKPGMTNSQKFRACFNYLLGYMHYRPKAFNPADFVGDDWPYKWALSVYQSNLTGNCYGFACCVAACAKELGYEPYVIVTTGDHGFVMIDGLYYDNMWGGQFGASSHRPYKTLYKVKF